MISQILLSNIIHKRFIPFKHTLNYNLPSLYLNIDHLENINKKYKFFSLNAFNIFSFYDRDHGYRDKRSIKSFVIESLQKYNIKYQNLNIFQKVKFIILLEKVRLELIQNVLNLVIN